MKTASIWKVWSLAWLAAIKTTEENRAKAVALYPMCWLALGVGWAQKGLYSLRTDAMVTVISPDEKGGPLGRNIVVWVIPILPFVPFSIWIQNILDVPSFVAVLISFSVALLLLAPAFFHAMGSGELKEEMISRRAARAWSKQHKIKPYYLLNFATRQDDLTPDAIQFLLDVYIEAVPSGAPVVLLADSEELAAMSQKHLGLTRMSSKGLPTIAFAGFKQGQGEAPTERRSELPLG